MKKAVHRMVFILTNMLFFGVAMAADDDHQHHDEHAGHPTMASEHGDMGGMFMQSREVDGYIVTFHVMAAGEGMRHSGSHNLMVKLEKDGLVIDDAEINSKVIFPDKRDKQQRLQRVGEWYMAGYGMQQSGRHQVLVLFRTADGKVHRSGLYYPK